MSTFEHRHSKFRQARRLVLFALALGGLSFSGCVRTDCSPEDLSCDERILLWSQSNCPATNSYHTFLGGATNVTSIVRSESDGSGGTIIAGITSVDILSNPLLPFSGAPGTLNNFVMRLDASGRNVLWSTYLEQSPGARMGVVVQSSGITVLTTASNPFGTPINPFQGGNDLLIVRLGLDGSLLWHTYQGSTGNDTSADLVVRGDGGFWLSGSVTGDLGGAAGTASFAHQSPGVNNGVAIQIDANGNAISNAIFGNAIGTNFDGLVAGDNGTVYFLGAAGGALAGVYGTPLVAFPGGGNNSALITKLAADGSLLYHTFQGENTQAQQFIDGVLQSDGSLIVATASAASYGSPLSPYSGGSTDYAISRYSAEGALQWLTFTGGTGSDDVTALAPASGGGIWLGGTSDVSFGTAVAPFTHQGGGANHSVVLRVDASGSVGAPRFFGTASTTTAVTALEETCESGLMVFSRTTGSYGANPLSPYAGGTLNSLLIRLDVGLGLSTL